MAVTVREHLSRQERGRSDAPFLIGLSILGGVYLLLIIAMLLADASFTSPPHLGRALASREIQYAIKLSLVSCSITAILSLWVAVPLGYLLSWHHFPGKVLIDAILDIPIVLPPLVIGLSLLILFQTLPGRTIERVTQNRMGAVIAYYLVPLALALGVLALIRLVEKLGLERATPGPVFQQRLPAGFTYGLALMVSGLSVLFFLLHPLGADIKSFIQQRFSTSITYAVPSVILAQFAVACAFAVRTMRVTFDQITPRTEQVALTLGCSRSQAFWLVVLPQARRGIITAGTLAWARASGEFGPILVFSGATRFHTEVLPTTVFLELSIGDIEAAVAVSLLMVVAAVIVLIIVRVYGMDKPSARVG